MFGMRWVTELTFHGQLNAAPTHGLKDARIKLHLNKI